MFQFNPMELKKTISENTNTDPEDVLKTKEALNKTGHYPIPSYGLTDIPDRPLINGIKTFQKENGLKVDGIMKPKGPTEQTLSDQLVPIKKPKPPAPPKPQASKFMPLPIVTLEPDGLKLGRDETPVTIMPIAKPLPDSPPKGIPGHIGIPTKPDGDSVQDRLKSLMSDPRYNDPKQEAYRSHVTQQFEKAYPGSVEYDETGKMVQPKAAITPDEVEGFGKMNALNPMSTMKESIENDEVHAQSNVTPCSQNASMMEVARRGRDQADKEIRYIKRDRKRDEEKLETTKRDFNFALAGFGISMAIEAVTGGFATISKALLTAGASSGQVNDIMRIYNEYKHIKNWLNGYDSKIAKEEQNLEKYKRRLSDLYREKKRLGC